MPGARGIRCPASRRHHRRILSHQWLFASNRCQPHRHSRGNGGPGLPHPAGNADDGGGLRRRVERLRPSSPHQENRARYCRRSACRQRPCARNVVLLPNRLPDYSPLRRYANVSSDGQNMELSVGTQMVTIQEYVAHNHVGCRPQARGCPACGNNVTPTLPWTILLGISVT